jgi:hypothetical protein
MAHLFKSESDREATASKFWKWFDAVSKVAKTSPIGMAMTANGFEPHHNGGGTLAWKRDVGDGAVLLICDTQNGFGDSIDETLLVGLHSQHSEAFVEDEVPDAAAAVMWCDRAGAAFTIARKWVKRIGGGFHPDTAGSRYTPAMSADEVEEYETDIEKFFADAPGDPYAFAVVALREVVK